MSLKKESDKEIILKNNAYVLIPITIIGVSQWNWGDPKFSVRNEGYFQENTRYGGADKTGHFYSSYLISDLMARKFMMDGMERDKAAYYAAASSIVVTGLIEIGDATSKHGFSRQDEVMNILGALSSYALFINPNLDKKIDFKIDYFPGSYKAHGRLFDDYDKARYIASLKLAGFNSLQNNFARFFEIQLSYRSKGYINNEAGKQRDIGIGIALNINQIIDYFTDGKNNPYVAGFFEYYQPHYTYVTHDYDLNR